MRKSTKKTKVAIFCGGRSAEHHISLNSAQSIYKNIDRKLYDPLLVRISPDGFFEAIRNIEDLDKKFPRKRKKVVDSFCDLISKYTIDIAFIIMHGPFGEDGSIQGLCESLKIPYVGSGVLGSAAALDKAVFKLALKGAGIPSADFKIVNLGEWKNTRAKTVKLLIEELGLPVMVKPSTLGSSIGINKANDKNSLTSALDEAFLFDEKVVVEKFLTGREIECAILGYGDEIKLLSTAEIITKNEFYDLEAKYEKGLTDIIIPAKLTKKEEKLLQETAKKACQVLEAEGFSRIDMFLVKGSKGNKAESVAYVNEINTIPGFTSMSVYPLQAKAAGFGYKKLITEIIRTAQIEQEKKNERFKETRAFIKSQLK